jgi:hypothetical protein
MSARKPNNSRARLARSLGAVLRTNHVAVINIEPNGTQRLINWKSCKGIQQSQKVADAVCDFAHRWTIYTAGLCQDQAGVRYIKAREVAPQGVYLAEHLTDLIEAEHKTLIATCNPMHLVASGWIAIPNDISLDEAQAAKLFEAAGAWSAVTPLTEDATK